jgi:hypothetical protein
MYETELCEPKFCILNSHLSVRTKKRSWLGGRLSSTDKRLGFVASYRQRYRLGSQADRLFHCLFDCRLRSYSRLPVRLLRSYSVPSLVVQLEIPPKWPSQPSMQSLLRLLFYYGSFRLTLLLSIFEVYFKLFTQFCEESTLLVKENRARCESRSTLAASYNNGDISCMDSRVNTNK